MGQHLILYASKILTKDEVEKWCYARTYELIETPTAENQLIADKVQYEMDQLRNTSHCLKHWSNWCGPMIWDFLVWRANIIDDKLVNEAVSAASKAMQAHEGLGKQYPTRDFANDTPIEFLLAHMGYVVWGDNSGI